MIDINLLPWREQKREEKKQHFFMAMGGSLGLSVVLVILLHGFFSGRISAQESRNFRLKQEIHVLNRKLREVKHLKEKKQRLLARIELIQKLQLSRPLAVHLFESFVRIMPDGVYMTQLKREGETIVLQGIAESHSAVSALMRKINHSRWISTAQLREIKEKITDKKKMVEMFEIHFRVNPPLETMKEEHER